ncbi:MAG: NAD+ synthase [Helicobacteraceae bacterium]|nr:NAD+ synthase [Helicobacteraceae bacterium]
MNKYEQISKFLILFLQNEVYKTGLKRVVLGLSGGLDSAVVAVLAKAAFGDGLLCVKMPSHYSSKSSLEDADELCEKFNINSVTKSIEPYLKAFELNEESTPLRSGNFSARMRMSTLFDVSAEQGALVLGTSNKSEIMLGYGTIFGDLASALNPIGDLYKTEVFELARHIGVVDSIIDKPPSADLWEGQSDEIEIGYTYARLDHVLKRHIEDGLTQEELIKSGEDEELVKMVIKRIYQNHFKRKMPVIAKLTSRTVGHDFNYPRDIGL